MNGGVKGSIFLMHLERSGFLERLALEEETVPGQRVKVGGGENRSEVNHLPHPLHRLLHLREGGREGRSGGHVSAGVEPVKEKMEGERGCSSATQDEEFVLSLNIVCP